MRRELIRLAAFVLVTAISWSGSSAAEPPKDELQATTENLRKQITALVEYHRHHGRFPAAFQTDAAGRPLLSWRVAILPQLGEHKLYVDFHLDEPWNSKHNLPLVGKMPKVFRAPDSKAKDGHTTYMGSGGPAGVIARPPVRMEEIIDGTAITIAVAEVGDAAAIEWTRPIEWAFQAPKSLPDFAGIKRENFFAVLVDGTVLSIPKTTPPADLRRLFNREEGELITTHLNSVRAN